MPARCAVSGCGNVSCVTSTIGDTVSVHKLPNSEKEPGIRAKWVAFVRRNKPSFTPTSSSVICTNHFKEEEIINLSRYKILLEGKPQHVVDRYSRFSFQLKPGAIPSLHPICTPKEERSRRPTRRALSCLAREAVREALLCSPTTVANTEDSGSDRFDVDSTVDVDCLDDPDWTDESVERENTEELFEFTTLKKLLNIEKKTLERKFIVSGQRLLEIVLQCSNCHGRGEQINGKLTEMGAVVRFKLHCKVCEHTWEWQNMGGRLADAKVVNSQLTGSILFSGAIPSTILSYMSANKIGFPSRSTFFENQRKIHIPVIQQMWSEKRNEAVSMAKHSGAATVAGDARCDSMGFSAQFCSYSMMDVKTKKILDIQPISKVETGMSSTSMEIEGLKRGLKKLKDMGVELKDLITDRHVQIVKYMATEHKDINHYFDCWHVVKSISKKLKMIQRKTGKEEISQQRITSIANRLYRMAQTTLPGPLYRSIMDEKRKAILGHIIGQHKFPEHQHFKKCTHERKRTKRMDKDGEAYKAISKYMGSANIRKAVMQMSPVGQTSDLESFHHTILSFAPKHLSFGYHGMMARLYLAALHFNENSARDPVLDEIGNPKMRVKYVKYRGGKGSANFIRPPPTQEYVTQLMSYNYMATVDEQYSLPSLPPLPPTMTSMLDTEDPSEVIKKYKHRF